MCSNASFINIKQLGSLESLCSLLLCKHMVLPPYLLVTVVSCPAFWLPFLKASFASKHPHSDAFVTNSDWELGNDGHTCVPLWRWWPTLPWFPASVLSRTSSFDRHSENVLCDLLCFQLSILLFTFLRYCKLHMEDGSMACYLLSMKRGLLFIREPMW